MAAAAAAAFPFLYDRMNRALAACTAVCPAEPVVEPGDRGAPLDFLLLQAGGGKGSSLTRIRGWGDFGRHHRHRDGAAPGLCVCSNHYYTTCLGRTHYALRAPPHWDPDRRSPAPVYPAPPPVSVIRPSRRSYAPARQGTGMQHALRLAENASTPRRVFSPPQAGSRHRPPTLLPLYRALHLDKIDGDALTVALEVVLGARSERPAVGSGDE